MQILMPCSCDKEEFESRGCWFAKKEAGQSTYTCSNPCVQRLIAQNNELKAKLDETCARLEELKGEI